MTHTDFVFRIGGEAGQGVESSGAGFATAFTRAGLHVVAVPDYYSRIRGGHNFFSIRVSPEPIYGLIERVDILIALTDETIERHLEAMAEGGIIILDDQSQVSGESIPASVTLLRAPLNEIAEKHGAAVMANTAALAVAAGLVDFDLDYLKGVVRDNFDSKGEAIVDANLAVLTDAYQWVKEQASFGRTLKPQESPKRIACNGNEAFAMGALTAGCKFVAAYPMTPATSVFEYMCKHAAKWGIATKHAESEIAAINMCIGAAHAGARAMAPTSGGGFDLMTEGLSLAGMTETPLVIYLAQRPGPATGLATRTAQTDLNLAMYAGHGEFPRVIMAPGTPEQAFDCAHRAFNIAEKYQCQVIVLSDQYLASSIFSQDRSAFNVTSPIIDRGKLLSAEEVEATDEYKRYALTEDGVSPRALPGSSPKTVYLATGNEHREDGHITEDASLAEAMTLKRNKKLEGIATEMQAPTLYGDPDAELTLVGWGSTYGTLVEVVDILNAKGKATRLVHFCDIWPFPANARKILGDKAVIVVEQNVHGQFETLLKQATGITVKGHIHRVDGRPFTVEYILRELEA